MAHQRRRAGSDSDDDSHDGVELDEEPLTPGQEKKEQFRPKSLFFGAGSIFSANNVNKLANLVSEVGTSISHIVAPLPEDEDDEQDAIGDDEDRDVGNGNENRSDYKHASNGGAGGSGEDVDRSLDDFTYAQQSKSRMASLALEPSSPSTPASFDEIDLSLSPRNLSTASSPPPFSLSSALLSANNEDARRGPPPSQPVAMAFLANEELQRKVELKYRDSIETELSSKEALAREQELELQSMRLLNSRLVEDQRALERRLAEKNAEIARLTGDLQAAAEVAAKESITAAVIASVQTSNESSVEIKRLSDALTESEAALKEAEEVAWKAKAEASEMLYALELEQSKSGKLRTELDETKTKVMLLEEKKQEQTVEKLEKEEEEKEMRGNDEALMAAERQLQLLTDANAALTQELTDAKKQVEASSDALKRADAAKAALAKAEKEGQQLQVVIKQLQQKQKGTREDVDTLREERDALKARVEELVGDSEELTRITSRSASDAGKMDTLSAELEAARARVQFLEGALDENQRRVAELDKAKYDLLEKQETMRSDTLLLQQELDQRRLETDNLHNTLQQVKREHVAWKGRSQDDVERKLDAQRKDHEAALLEFEASWRQKIGEQEELIRLGNQRCQDEALLRRKAEIDLNAEKRKMKKTLDDTLAQLQNSQADVVDRTLLANLLVAYFKRGRPLDVLQLISKVLSFSEEQEQAVGLKVPPINLIGTLYTTIVGAPPKPLDVEGDNLAELWANFLEMEAKEAQGVGQTPTFKAPAKVPVAPPSPPPVLGSQAPLDFTKSPHLIRPAPMPGVAPLL